MPTVVAPSPSFGGGLIPPSFWDTLATNAFIAAIAGALLSAVFIVWWDTYKTRQERRERDQAVLRALRQEVNANLTIIAFNKKTVTDEQEAKGPAVIPLTPIYNGFASLLVTHLPAKFATDQTLLSDVEGSMRTIATMNELMNRREGLAQQRHAMAPAVFVAQWRQYTLALQVGFEQVEKSLAKIQPRL